jgi:hypothetical protein
VESYNNENMDTYSMYNIKKDWNNKLIYRYDPGIMGIMPVAGGCLTRTKTQRCLAV